MSNFSIEWLDLRESADHAARNADIVKALLEWLEKQESPITLVDLGTGTGSTLRALSATIEVRWRLVDYDSILLKEAQQRHQHLNISTYNLNLNHIAELPLDNADVVTASALFDLVSPQFVDQLVNRLTKDGLGLYAALSYDGTTEWLPAHPLDATVLAAFNRDQQTDKGLGRALGPDATAYLQQALEDAGYTVITAASPWQLNGKDQLLVSELIRGIASAVAQDNELDKSALESWTAFRLANAANGRSIIGHQDLLAFPA